MINYDDLIVEYKKQNEYNSKMQIKQKNLVNENVKL